jgi:RHS repeat-associated protein
VPATEIRYAYENWKLIGDYTVSGSTLTLAHSYLWGIDLSGNRRGAGGVGGLLAMVAGAGAIEIPVYDANGNIHGLTDRGTGQITAAYEYSPFGQALRATGAYALTNPFRFSSKYTDNETDHVYYGHRYYNPMLGRFLGRDPIQEKGGLHLYGFAGNNSVNRWDYLGNNPLSASQSSIGDLMLSDGGALEGFSLSYSNQMAALANSSLNGPLSGANDVYFDDGSPNAQVPNPSAPLPSASQVQQSSGNTAAGPITDATASLGTATPNNAALAAAATDGVGSAPAGYAVQQSWTTAHGGTNAVLYYNATTGATILAYQGTSSWSDVGTDIYNALGGQSTRYTSAVAIAQGVQDQYSNTVLTGVSLGGGEAALASVQTGMTAYTFNAAGVNPNNYNITGSTSQITNYSVATDALTNFQAITPFPSALGSQVTLSPGNLWYALNPFAAHGSGSILAAMGGGG